MKGGRERDPLGEFAFPELQPDEDLSDLDKVFGGDDIPTW